MLLVRDIMTPHVVTLAPDATLREAIDTLVACRIGGAPVAERGKIVGVLSARDVLEFEAAAADELALGVEADDAGALGEDAVSESVVEWEESDEPPATFFTGVREMTDLDIDAAVEDYVARSDDLMNRSIAEVMSRTVCTVPADMEVSAAAQRMLSAGVQRALVTEDGKLTGILTTTDILRAVAERRIGGPKRSSPVD
ncbi:MAG TPA: CBS domain-containing protein [Gemmatimonadaceae bacterium]|nr:CBS domain-containing protein [Gemmatimonadaceae bacterium]